MTNNQEYYNHAQEIHVTYDNITSGYVSVFDFTTDYTKDPYHHLMIESSLNSDVKLLFLSSSKDITISAYGQYAYDDFLINGNLEVKAVSDLPSTGSLYLRVW